MPINRTLRINMHGDDVKELQELLIQKGYDVGKRGADSVFGPDTKIAVEAFQRDHKTLKVDGAVGEKTLPALLHTPDKPALNMGPARRPVLDYVKVNHEPVHPPQEKPVSSPHASRPMNKGEIRLAQAYLKVMDYFGPTDTVKAVSVVHGKLNPATKSAFQAFADTHSLPSAAPTVQLLDTIIDTHKHFVKSRSQLAAGESDIKASAQRVGIDLAFKQVAKPPHGIETLHPQMRFPVMAVIEDLKAQGIRVSIRDTFRAPEKQAELVKKGFSCSPPGYSFHGQGLAIDILPCDAKGNAITNAKHPRFKALIASMQAHGFFSMYQSQGWDAPHFELPAKTSDMISWPVGKDGWKMIPDRAMPPEWRDINSKKQVQHFQFAAPQTVPDARPAHRFQQHSK